MAVPVFVFQIRVPIKYHQRTFALQGFKQKSSKSSHYTANFLRKAAKFSLGVAVVLAAAFGKR